MVKLRSVLGSAGILAATTLGAGIFSLPYVFKVSGYLTGIFYLLILGALIIFAHHLYWKALVKVRERNRLLGIVKEYMGGRFFGLAFIAIIGGLLLTLVVYLILGNQFLKMIFPGLNPALGILIFWGISSLPLVFRALRLARIESLGFFLMAAIIVLIFATAPNLSLASGVSFDFSNVFLPFGAILFSIAGWTAIEPMFENSSAIGSHSRGIITSLTLGTLGVAVLYVLFVAGIFGSAQTITEDTISGLANWPIWKLELLGWLGLFAIWTSYVPIGLEIKNSLTKDLKVSDFWGLAVVLFAPLLLVVLGLKDFLTVVGLAGGIFLSLQYLFIVLVARKVLALRGAQGFFAGLAALVFILGAVYEVYYFVVK